MALWRATGGLIALAALGLAAGLQASGAVRQVGLDEAVRQAGMVLLVEKAEPAEETLTYQRSYPAEDGGHKVARFETRVRRFKVIEKLGGAPAGLGATAAESYLHPGQQHRVELPQLAAPGQLIRLLDHGTVINHGVELRRLADGTRKIPIYPRLADAASDAQVEQGTRFVLLAHYDAHYEAFVGHGGHGLVAVDKLKKVRRLLRRRPR